ncbi:MAG: type II/IV secretion system protein [FCB group bacterium]|jgi:type IV pilus assembly protein PilB|nr:type II/IV secretion system protein [FCB group bacterium]
MKKTLLSPLFYQFHPKSERREHLTLGQTLVDMGALTEAQLREALAEQNTSGRLLGDILLSRGFIDKRAKAIALARQHGLEFCDLESTPSEPRALEAITERVARKNDMLPVRIEGDRLLVLIANPQQRHALKNVGIELGKRIYPMLTDVKDLREEIAARYLAFRTGKLTPPAKTVAAPSPAAAQVVTADKSQKTNSKNKAKGAQVMVDKPVGAEPGTEGLRFEDIAKQASGVPVIKLVTTIIEGAAKAGATDIHLDPQDSHTRVRYRIDGVLHDVMQIPHEVENAVISRIKILSDLDITETRRPQDGHISLETKNRGLDIRVATLPTYLGERVVLRLLDQSSVLQGIGDLGLENEDRERMERLIAQPYGMILVTGPTGSGKTTTLYSALNEKNVTTDSIVTLEDPVEYQVEGINQVQIDPDIGMTFANTLRASLRQDIDVLLVGEIRDADTARIAIRAAMTGHLVFSTLHTNDAPEAISTLRNMGVPSYLIASALTAVVGQRLVRLICPDCKKAYAPAKTLLKSAGLPESVKKLYRGEGCSSCYGTGNRGRTGIFEVLEVTPNVRKMIAEDQPIEKICAASGLKTMADRCRQKLRDGQIPAEEFLRVIRT